LPLLKAEKYYIGETVRKLIREQLATIN